MAEIHQALNSDPTDVAALRRLAISEGGLLTDEIRRKVWPKLLNVNSSEPPPVPGKGEGQCCSGTRLAGTDTRILGPEVYMPTLPQE